MPAAEKEVGEKEQKWDKKVGKFLYVRERKLQAVGRFASGTDFERPQGKKHQ